MYRNLLILFGVIICLVCSWQMVNIVEAKTKIYVSMNGGSSEVCGVVTNIQDTMSSVDVMVSLDNGYQTYININSPGYGEKIRIGKDICLEYTNPEIEALEFQYGLLTTVVVIILVLGFLYFIFYIF